MFVDDEEINLFLFERDFKVLMASKGREGLEKMAENVKRIKVVVSDMRTPNMNGLESVEIAKEKFAEIEYSP